MLSVLDKIKKLRVNKEEMERLVDKMRILDAVADIGWEKETHVVEGWKIKVVPREDGKVKIHAKKGAEKRRIETTVENLQKLRLKSIMIS